MKLEHIEKESICFIFVSIFGKKYCRLTMYKHNEKVICSFLNRYLSYVLSHIKIKKKYKYFGI